MWLSSELMFFAALFAMYFTIRSVTKGDGGPWPSAHLDIPYASVNTTILVLSSVTCQMGVFAAERGQVRRLGSIFNFKTWGLREWYFLSFLMGAVFVAGQLNEYRTLVGEGTTISSSAYGSVFYLTTGFHGLHVTGGLIAFLFMLGRTYRRQALDPRAGDERDRRVLLLALRRRGLDRAIRHDLPASSSATDPERGILP